MTRRNYKENRFLSIQSNRHESQSFQTPCTIQGNNNFQISRKSTSRITNRHQENDSCRFISIESNRQHFQPTLHSRRLYFLVSRKSTSGITNRHKGNDSCRFDRIESNRQHFRPTLHAPARLYFLSLAQIDFRDNESTPGETICHHSLESSRIDNIFNPPCIYPRGYIF